jgi:hypothetical protein
MDKQVNASPDIVEASIAGFIERRDYQDLTDQATGRRDRPIVVVANARSTMTEAVDAALAGLPLALLPAVPGSGSTPAPAPWSSPDSSSCPPSCPAPSSSTRAAPPTPGGTVSYIGAADTTIDGSRSGAPRSCSGGR